jgi:uncharacterized membrane protein
MDEILVFGVLVCCIIPVVAALVLSGLAAARSRHIEELRARLQRVEQELSRLRLALPSEGRPTAPEPAAALAPMVPAAAPAEAEVPLEVIPVEPAQPSPPARPLAPPPVPEIGIDAAAVEEWIGKRGLGWAAVILLLFATAFFLKYAFENEWIGELGRVSIGVIAGVALCVAGLRYHRRGWQVFSQMLTAGGVVLLYLATYGAFGYYHLLPRSQAGVFLVILIAETLALAAVYRAPAIAIMAIIGGLLNPILLHTGIDQYQALFLYLFLLNAGAIGLVLWANWPAVATVALLGTQLLFWGWYGEHYHPEKLGAALGFQLALFALYLLPDVFSRPASLERLEIHLERLARLLLNALFIAVAGYVLLDEDYHVWMGSLALGMASVYAALAWHLLRRHQEQLWPFFVATATSMGFLAMVFPLQANAAWIAVGWAAQGLALWWFGLRIRAIPLRVIAAVFLSIALIRLLTIDMPWLGREPFIPVFNKFCIPGLAIAVCVLGVAGARRWLPEGRGPGEKEIAALACLAGVGLIWLLLSVDTYQWWIVRIGRPGTDAVALRRSAQTSLSVLWAAYAAVILTLGFRADARILRWAALALFALTLGKVFLVDLAGLPGFYRVVAFFVLSLMMGAAAWGYNRIEAARRTAA